MPAKQLVRGSSTHLLYLRASGPLPLCKQPTLSSRRIEQHSTHASLLVDLKRNSNRKFHHKEVLLALGTQPELRESPPHGCLDGKKATLLLHTKHALVRHFVLTCIAS